MATAFLGNLGYNLKNTLKTFFLECFLWSKYIQNDIFMLLSTKSWLGMIFIVIFTIFLISYHNLVKYRH